MFVPFFHFLSSVFYIAIKSTMSHQDFYKTQLFGFDLRHFLCHTDSLMRWRTASTHFPMNNPVGQWMLLALDSYPILRLVNRCQFMVSEVCKFCSIDFFIGIYEPFAPRYDCNLYVPYFLRLRSIKTSQRMLQTKTAGSLFTNSHQFKRQMWIERTSSSQKKTIYNIQHSSHCFKT